jgi:MSHA pilin protein MshB
MKRVNIANVKSANQAGFTIIELIVVILLLGILTATALPRFIGVSDNAHTAAFNGVLGGYSTGMALGRAQWVANGEPTTAILSFGTGTLLANASGIIQGLSAAVTDTSDCIEIFNGVLQGGRPLVNTSAATAAGADATIAEIVAAAALNTGINANTNPWVAITNTGQTECEYYYVAQNRIIGAGNVPGFALVNATGEITNLNVTN